MNVGFTGTQHGMSQRQKETFEKVFESLFPEMVTFIHGDCIGADEEAHNKAMKHLVDIDIFPPIKKSKRAFCHQHPKIKNTLKVQPEAIQGLTVYKLRDGRSVRIHPQYEYLKRNRLIIRKADALIATPGQKIEQIRSGTWYTVRRARERNLPIFIIFPDGLTKPENTENLQIQGDLFNA